MKYMVCGGAHFLAALMTIDELGTRLPGVNNKTWCPFPGGGALDVFLSSAAWISLQAGTFAVFIC